MIQIDAEACCACGLCVGVCPPDALEIWEDQLKVMPNCTDCGWCVRYCPVGALSEVPHGRVFSRPSPSARPSA